MTLKEMILSQKTFDSQHSSLFDWDIIIDEDNIEMLEFLLLSITGELGEAANIVKKVRRGDFLLVEKKDEIGEELVDILIYLLKVSYQLNIDLEEIYEKKMKKNKERFKHYERNQK